MIRRVKDYDKKAPSRDAHKVYVVCEGSETEPNYFSFFEGLSSNLQVEVIPSIEGKTDPLKLMEHACAVFLSDSRKYAIDYLQGDTIWFVIDTDSWEREGKIKPLRDFCQLQNKTMSLGFNEIKPYNAWNVAQSNPCFEIWLYYHFYANKPESKDVESFPSFKEFVHGSVAGGFNNQRDQVRLQDAIKNTEYNYSVDDDSRISLYSSEVYNLGKEILGFVKRDLDRLRNKM